MAGLAGLALGTVPIAGGALLAVAAGQFKGPDFRALIKQDQDLLDRIPQEQTARRAELQRTIDMRIDDLISVTYQSRSLREAASAYKGNWRDVVLVLCIVLFAVIWWNVPHSRTNWLPTLIVLILLGVVAAVYAMRGLTRSLSMTMHRHNGHDETRN
jgi:F0F1-type ATP synthase assembly protein I